MRAVALALFLASSVAVCQCPKDSSTCVTTTRPNDAGGTTTSTRWDNQAHVDAVDAAAQRGTRDALAYFFVVRPSLTTLRNERINNIEGQFTPAYEILDALAASDVSAAPTRPATKPSVKNHQLGEDWSEFLVSSPNLKTQADACAAKKRITPQSKRKVVFNPCLDMWRLAEDPEANATFDCMEPSFGVGKDVLCQEFNGEVSFQQGKLASLKIVLPGGWNERYPSIVEKFGPPSALDHESTLGIWKTDSFYLIGTEFDGDTALSWMTVGKYKDEAARAKAVVASQEQRPGDSW